MCLIEEDEVVEAVNVGGLVELEEALELVFDVDGTDGKVTVRPAREQKTL